MYIKYDEHNKNIKIKIEKYLCVLKSFDNNYYYEILTYYNNLREGIDKYDFEGKGFYRYDSSWGYRKVNDVIAYKPIEKYISKENEED